MEINLMVYVEGLVYSVIATILFASFDWIIIESKRRFYVIPLIVFISWTAMFIVGSLLWFLVLLFGLVTFGIGILIGFGISGYLLLKIVLYVTPEDWANFSSDQFHLFCMGAFYLLTYYLLI